MGSDLMVLGAGLIAKDVKMSRARVRLINLGGVLGTVFGFGIDLLVQPEDVSTTIAIAGLGSAGGLVLGTTVTKNYDKDKELTLAPKINPSLRFCILRDNSKDNEAKKTISNFEVQKNLRGRMNLVPGIGLALRF